MSTKSKQVTKTKNVITAKAPPVVSKSPVDLYFLGLVFIIICVSFIRFRLLNVPLERDEGEYAYMGNLILNGLAPYKEAYNMKLPGTYMMYALIMALFGKTIAGIHTGFLLLNAGTMFIFFVAFRRLFNCPVAFFAASVYGITALSGSVLGFAAHATHFVSFFAALGIFFVSKFYQKETVLFSFLSGLMFGAAFMMKQQAVFFLAFGGLAVLLPYLLKKPIPFIPIIKQGLLFTSGAVLPYLVTLLVLGWVGAFDKFWFWTVSYASKYASGLPLQQGLAAFKSSFLPMWSEFAFVWVLFFAGIILVFLSSFPLREKIFAAGFTLFGFLTICPGFYFRQHYFVSWLPAIGLVSAIGLYVILSFLAQSIKAKSLAFLLPVVFVLFFVTVLGQRSEYYLQSDPEEISKIHYGSNPFVESVEIADFISQHTTPSDKIVVIGSEPQIYVYADRLSATGYLYTYGLVENHAYNRQMQEEMIAEIEKVKPKFIVYCNVVFSWLYHPGAPRRIFEWADSYTSQYYEPTGIIDLANPYQAVYKWNDEAKNYQPTGNEYIKVFKLK